MTNEKRMKQNNPTYCFRLWGTGLLFLFLMPLWAQDPFPSISVPQPSLAFPEENLSEKYPPRIIPVDETILSSFRGTKENQIEDPQFSLFPIFDKLQMRVDPVRIVSIGDSHVRGHVFTYTTRLLLEKDFGNEAVTKDSVSYRTSGLATETGKPGMVFHIFGVNGATAASFNTDEHIREIANLHPDLIILSFGTNEAHGRYHADSHLMQIDQLVTRLRQACPEVAFLLTTPPGAYKGRRRNHYPNPFTANASKTITDYAKQKGLASWDLYNIVGGRQNALFNWNKNNLIRRDGIHYVPEGYQLQGTLLYQALIKAYNRYVESRME